jgi:hypothetical protein
MSICRPRMAAPLFCRATPNPDGTIVIECNRM